MRQPSAPNGALTRLNPAVPDGHGAGATHDRIVDAAMGRAVKSAPPLARRLTSVAPLVDMATATEETLDEAETDAERRLFTALGDEFCADHVHAERMLWVSGALAIECDLDRGFKFGPCDTAEESLGRRILERAKADLARIEERMQSEPPHVASSYERVARDLRERVDVIERLSAPVFALRVARKRLRAAVAAAASAESRLAQTAAMNATMLAAPTKALEYAQQRAREALVGPKGALDAANAAADAAKQAVAAATRALT